MRKILFIAIGAVLSACSVDENKAYVENRAKKENSLIDSMCRVGMLTKQEAESHKVNQKRQWDSMITVMGYEKFANMIRTEDSINRKVQENIKLQEAVGQISDSINDSIEKSMQARQ